MRYLLVALLAVCALAPTHAEEPAIFQEIDELVADLERFTGLKALRKVPSDTITKEG